jgi:hypothetical protein
MSLGLEEFAAAIGVQLPQDENMMSIVEQLFSSELPEGWTQHRSSKGTVYVLPFPRCIFVTSCAVTTTTKAWISTRLKIPG